MISRVYAAAASYRRHHYARHPEKRRRLSRPVISIGNLAVGGRGKTPLVAWIAARLLAAGERPSILSRGYGRRHPDDGVVVVRDPSGIRADVDRGGDEPLMLARQLAGVSVLVSGDRYVAGRLAERHFGSTVHLLDDGFQHFAIQRDVDLVIVSADDLRDPRTLPSGRLREPLAAMRSADAIIQVDDGDVRPLAPGCPVWRAHRRLDAPRLVEPYGAPAAPDRGTVLAVAGIARPARFVDDLQRAGWPVARALTFRDHHPYSARDVAWIFDEARAEGADLVVTTEKDLVRLLPFRPFPLALAWAPLVMSVEPADGFEAWLLDAVARARENERD